MNRAMQLVCLIITLLVGNITGTNAQLTNEEINKKILLHYDSSIHPSEREGRSVGLTMELQIKEFSVQNEYYTDAATQLSIKGLFMIKWNDVRLAWNSNVFQGKLVESTLIDNKYLWNPNFGLEKTFNEDEIQCTGETCVVRNNGTVTFIQHCAFDATCDNNVERWPYGSINCTLRLGSWDRIDDGNVSVEHFHASVITERGVVNTHWRTISISSKLIRSNSVLHDKTFTLLAISFIFERLSSFNVAIVLTPAIAIVIMNLLSLWQPIGSNIRYAILLIVFHAHFVLYQYLSWVVPKNGETTPLILVFFRDSLILTTFLMVFLTIAKSFTTRQHPTHRWIDAMIHFIDRRPWIAFAFPTADDVSNKPPNEVTSDDRTNFIHGNTMGPMTTTYCNQWKRLSLILDRTCFFSLLVVYSVMFICFIPASNIRPNEIDPPVLNILEHY